MAFDFNKGPGTGGSPSGFKPPFGSGSQQNPPGGAGSSNNPFKNSPPGNKPAVNKPASGFDKLKNRTPPSGRGFGNLPQVTTRKPPNPPSNLLSGFDPSSIPWKAIIYFILVVAAVALIIGFWDVITYVMYNLIAMLIVIIILLLVIRSLFRRRR